MVSSQLRYYPTVTRQSYRNMGRITELIETARCSKTSKCPR
jgi:ferredoxin--NADP+ reductase